MLLFSRQVVLRGDPRKTSSWAQEMAALVNRKTDLDVSLWAATGGAPVGSYEYSTLVESQVTLDVAMRGLLTDDEYLDLVAAFSEHSAAPPEDRLFEIVHTAGGTYQRAQVGAVVSRVTADVVPGKHAAAFRWGVEVADLVTEITGIPSLFGRAVFGPFGGLAWVQTAPDLATFEPAWEQVGKDSRYHAKLDETGGLFADGSGQVVFGRRVA